MPLPGDESCDSLRTLVKSEHVPAEEPSLGASSSSALLQTTDDTRTDKITSSGGLHNRTTGRGTPCGGRSREGTPRGGRSREGTPGGGRSREGTPKMSLNAMSSTSTTATGDGIRVGSREGTPTRTPNRTPATKRKDLLAIGGIEINKRRSSSSASYRIEKNKVLMETASGEIQELEILETKEMHGVFRRALPILSVPLAAICCVLNLVPGLGTLLSACLLGGGCGVAVELEGGGRAKGAAYNLLVALLQLLLSPVIVGWIWSVQRGALMLQEAVRRQIAIREHPEEPQVT